MVTEWGTVNADGEGNVNLVQTNEWMNFLRDNGISHMNWVVHDQPAGSSILLGGGSTAGGWSDSDLTPSGQLVKSIIKGWGTGFVYPEVVIANTDPDDGRMSELGRRSGLAQSASSLGIACGVAVQLLDCDPAPEAFVPCLVDLSHRAMAEQDVEAVASEFQRSRLFHRFLVVVAV